jgi:hypothetical protein
MAAPFAGHKPSGKSTSQSIYCFGKDVLLIRKQLMRLALDNNLNIISMQKSSGSLEDIFKELTVQK